MLTTNCPIGGYGSSPELSTCFRVHHAHAFGAHWTIATGNSYRRRKRLSCSESPHLPFGWLCHAAMVSFGQEASCGKVPSWPEYARGGLCMPVIFHLNVFFVPVRQRPSSRFSSSSSCVSTESTSATSSAKVTDVYDVNMKADVPPPKTKVNAATTPIKLLRFTSSSHYLHAYTLTVLYAF